MYVSTHGMQVCDEEDDQDAAAAEALGVDGEEAPPEPGAAPAAEDATPADEDPDADETPASDETSASGGACWTALSLGAEIATPDPEAVEAEILDGFGYADAPGVSLAWGGERVLPVMDGRWLAARYGGGLQDTLVYVTACQSARAGDLTAGLSGERSVFLGWSDKAFSSHAKAASVRFFTEAAERGITSTDAHDAVVEAGRHRSQGAYGDGELDAELVHHAPGTDLRIREVIELQDPEAGDRLVDGDLARVGSGNGAGDDPTLQLQIEVDGVLAGQAGDFEVEVVVDGEVVAEGWQLDAVGGQADDEVWVISADVALPAELADAEALTIDARVHLPEGGISQHVVELRFPAFVLHIETEIDTRVDGFSQTERVEGSIELTAGR